MRPARSLVLFVVALAAGACSRAPKDPVEALLARLEAAAEARDAEAFAAELGEGFRAEHGLDRAAATDQLRRYFAAYETIALEVYGVAVAREGETRARVDCVVEASGRARRLPGLEGFVPPDSVYRFSLDVSPHAGGWRVDAARWERVVAEP